MKQYLPWKHIRLDFDISDVSPRFVQTAAAHHCHVKQFQVVRRPVVAKAVPKSQ
jgi:hypothetical protein